MPNESEEENSGDGTIKPSSASGIGRGTGSGTISYASGFPKQQLGFAKRARDKVGEIEAVFGGKHVDKISNYETREHQRNVVSALINSLGFLEGQKYWFIYRLEDRDWNFKNKTEIQKTGWKGLEDAFVRMLKESGRNSDILKNAPVYDEIKVLRKFRNDLLHFESPMVPAGKESNEYDVNRELEKLDFPENPVAPHNTYPFKWFSYELAERSVQHCFTYWRFFARGLNMEEEFLKGVPSP